MGEPTRDAPPCAPPDFDPRPPQEPLPAGACDCHAHICGPAAAFPYASDRVYTPPDAALPQYLQLLRTLGVTRAVLVQPSVYGTDNSAMLAALREVGGGLRAVAVADPSVRDEELRSWHEAGVRGLRLNLVDRHENRNAVPTEAVRALANRIAPLGWHLEFLVNLDEAEGFGGALRDLPTPVVLGHFGYPRGGAAGWENRDAFGELLRLLDSDRCWVKLTGPYRISGAPDLPYGDVDAVARELVRAAPERLLWGTDWPHVMMKKPMPNDGPLCDLLERWLPDGAVRSRVLRDNPATFYGFTPDEAIPR